MKNLCQNSKGLNQWNFFKTNICSKVDFSIRWRDKSLHRLCPLLKRFRSIQIYDIFFSEFFRIIANIFNHDFKSNCCFLVWQNFLSSALLWHSSRYPRLCSLSIIENEGSYLILIQLFYFINHLYNFLSVWSTREI